jgi:hypothetical protein
VRIVPDMHEYDAVEYGLAKGFRSCVGRLTPARSAVRGCRGPHGTPWNPTDPRGPHQKNVKIVKSWQTAANYPPRHMGALGQVWRLSRGGGTAPRTPADPTDPHGTRGQAPQGHWEPRTGLPRFLIGLGLGAISGGGTAGLNNSHGWLIRKNG